MTSPIFLLFPGVFRVNERQQLRSPTHLPVLCFRHSSLSPLLLTTLLLPHSPGSVGAERYTDGGPRGPSRDVLRRRLVPRDLVPCCLPRCCRKPPYRGSRHSRRVVVVVVVVVRHFFVAAVKLSVPVSRSVLSFALKSCAVNVRRDCCCGRCCC